MKRNSLYTLFFQAEGNNYIFNTQSLAKIQVSDDLYKNLKNSKFDKIDENTLSILMEKKIIVEEDELYTFFNEMAIKTNIANFDSSSLTLFIIPTMGCNFACPYCFEGVKEQKSMTDETIDNIINFLNLSVANTLSIHWYGGEPLMRFDLIKKIYNSIVERTAFKIIDQSIITNGYLINEKMIDFFNNTNLRHIQITLDGCKETHNKKRFNKTTQEGSFDKIVSNICRVSKELPHTRVNVRINIDKNNYQDFIPLYDFLHKECDSNNNIYVYPAVIKKCDKTMADDSIYFSNEELYPLFKYFKNHGCPVNFFPTAHKHTCVMCNVFAYTIGPKGEIYKCPEDANNLEKVIGYVNSKDLTRSSLMFRYLCEGSQFNRSICRECFCFPLCFGGCAKDYLRMKYYKDKVNFCHPLKNKEIIKQAFLEDLHTVKDNNIPANRIIDIY